MDDADFDLLVARYLDAAEDGASFRALEAELRHSRERRRRFLDQVATAHGCSELLDHRTAAAGLERVPVFRRWAAAGVAAAAAIVFAIVVLPQFNKSGGSGDSGSMLGAAEPGSTDADTHSGRVSLLDPAPGDMRLLSEPSGILVGFDPNVGAAGGLSFPGLPAGRLDPPPGWLEHVDLLCVHREPQAAEDIRL